MYLLLRWRINLFDSRWFYGQTMCLILLQHKLGLDMFFNKKEYPY